MSCQISVKRYRRCFRHPLRTARGEWSLREGFIIRVEKSGQVGYGEVAPIPEFGSESVSTAAAFLKKLVLDTGLKIPHDLPCCRFGLSAAFENAGNKGKKATTPSGNYPVAAFLPPGKNSLLIARKKVESGYKSLKLKIGMEAISKELEQVQHLLESLPGGVRLRPDANGGLSREELDRWLRFFGCYRKQVEYIEQPLAVGEEARMAAAMIDSGIPIALDESLNGNTGVRWPELGTWPGPLVIKAALMGDVNALCTRLRAVTETMIVFSSVFETGIGVMNTLALADSLLLGGRPMGFDTLDAFDDLLTPIRPSPYISAEACTPSTSERIWNSI